MEKKFGASDWKNYIPKPICEAHPEYSEFYEKAWELAFSHIKNIPGMPQNPYMDEAFCETQVWIWDTCFMSLFCKYAQEIFPGVETLQNFYQTLHGNLRFPSLITPEDEPEWTHTTPGVPCEIKMNIADNPPLFAWAEYENALFRGDLEHLRSLLYDQKILQKHYDWFENLKEHTMLDQVFCETCLIAEPCGYHWEGGRSGMDNTPRGRIGEHAYEPRPNNPDMLWIDAICQQALAAQMIAKLFALLGDTEEEASWLAKHEEKKKIINELYWDDSARFYYDIDCKTHAFYPVMTIASYWAMTSETATPERAEALCAQLENPQTLGGVVPFLSLARNDADYDPTGRYWRGGVWLPTAYATLKGLLNYGKTDLAHRSAMKLLDHMYKTYRDYEPHTIWESYNPEVPKPASAVCPDTEPCVRKDFCGWSALGPISVYLEFVLGFHTIDAFRKLVKWEKPNDLSGTIGIRNLRFGDIVTDILCDGTTCTVTSNAGYTLEINGIPHEISCGETKIQL